MAGFRNPIRRRGRSDRVCHQVVVSWSPRSTAGDRAPVREARAPARARQWEDDARERDTAALRTEMARLATAISDLQAEQRKRPAALDDVYLRQIDVLERRVGKLSEQLEQRDLALVSLHARHETDEGVASIYKDAQGLSDLDPRRDSKQYLMRRIFDANVELRNRLGSREKSA